MSPLPLQLVHVDPTIAPATGDVPVYDAGTGVYIPTAGVVGAGNVSTSVTLTSGQLVIGAGTTNIGISTTTATVTKLSSGTPSAATDGTDYLSPSTGPKKIAESLLGSDQASISFTSIPSTFRHLLIIVTGRTTDAATINNIFLRFNNDSGANYDVQRLETTNNLTTNAAVYGQTSAICGIIPGAGSSSASQAGLATITCANYAGTAFFKDFSAVGGGVCGTSGSNNFTIQSHGNWRSTAAINRVDLFPASNNFLTGTLASIYGTP